MAPPLPDVFCTLASASATAAAAASMVLWSAPPDEKNDRNELQRNIATAPISNPNIKRSVGLAAINFTLCRNDGFLFCVLFFLAINLCGRN